MPGIGQTMKEFKKGKLHSGSKEGPKVKSRAQAIAIGMSEAGLAKKVSHFNKEARKHGGY